MDDFMDELLEYEEYDEEKVPTLEELKQKIQVMDDYLKLDLDHDLREKGEMLRDHLQEMIDLHEELDELLREREEIRQNFRKDVAENRRLRKRVGRNAPCPCGSGLKFKNCCGRG